MKDLKYDEGFVLIDDTLAQGFSANASTTSRLLACSNQNDVPVSLGVLQKFLPWVH